MKTFKIIGKTNEWIAQRDTMFNGKTEITIESGLSLEKAQSKLLDFFCEDYEVYASSLQEAEETEAGSQLSIFEDGTATYWYDSRTFTITEEEDN